MFLYIIPHHTPSSTAVIFLLVRAKSLSKLKCEVFQCNWTQTLKLIPQKPLWFLIYLKPFTIKIQPNTHLFSQWYTILDTPSCVILSYHATIHFIFWSFDVLDEWIWRTLFDLGTIVVWLGELLTSMFQFIFLLFSHC